MADGWRDVPLTRMRLDSHARDEQVFERIPWMPVPVARPRDPKLSRIVWTAFSWFFARKGERSLPGAQRVFEQAPGEQGGEATSSRAAVPVPSAACASSRSKRMPEMSESSIPSRGLPRAHAPLLASPTSTITHSNTTPNLARRRLFSEVITAETVSLTHTSIPAVGASLHIVGKRPPPRQLRRR